IVKPGKSNSGPDQLSRIQSGYDAQSIEDTMLDPQLYKLNCVPSELEDIFIFLCIGIAPKIMKSLEKKQLSIHVKPFMLINGDLYKLGQDEVLHQFVLEYECTRFMEEAHGGIVGGHYA
ncbi:hypothetical protein KI387_029816, partial [Taxus chinensis]